MLLVTGRISGFITLLAMFTVMYISLRAAAGKEETPYIRRVAGLDAMEESVERSVEMNRPVLAGYGIGMFGPSTLAAFSILDYVARQCARTGCELIVPCGGDLGTSIVYPHAIEVVRTAYDKEGKSEDFKVENMPFLSEYQFAFGAAQLGIIHDRQPGAVIYASGGGPEILALCEEAKSVGSIAISVGSLYTLSALAIMCDYVLIGEEQYAAGAYLSGDRVQIGTLRGQDWGKIIGSALIILGVIAKTLGSDVISGLLSL